MMTGELNTALGYIDQAMCEAEGLDDDALGLDDDAFGSLHRLLADSQNIIKSVIGNLEGDADTDDTDIDADTDGGDSE